MKKALLIILLLLGFSTFIFAQQKSVFPSNSNTLHTEKVNDPRKTVLPGKAALLSLILPGAGELYLGHKNFFTFFLSTEITTWTSLIGNHLFYQHLVREYQIYARQHAGFNPDIPRDDRFWVDIGKYDDIYSFNEQRERQRNFEDLYALTPDNYWHWDNHANRLKYDSKRIHANLVDNKRVYFQLAIVLNHLISGINALRLARKHNRALKEQKVGFRFDAFQETKYSQYIGFNLNLKF